MEHNQIDILDRDDILDREDRIFKSFQEAIDLMAGSHSKEVRNAQVLLDFLVEEYQACRVSLHASIKNLLAVNPPAPIADH